MEPDGWREETEKQEGLVISEVQKKLQELFGWKTNFFFISWIMQIDDTHTWPGASNKELNQVNFKFMLTLNESNQFWFIVSVIAFSVVYIPLFIN